MVVGAVVSHSVVGEVVGLGVLVEQALSGAGEDASPDGPYLRLHVPHQTLILIQIPPFLPVRNKHTNHAIKTHKQVLKCYTVDSRYLKIQGTL